MTVSIEWNEDAVKKDVYGTIDKIVSDSAYVGERVAKQNARVKTNRMRSNIEVVKLGAFLYGLQCLVEYAAANELGWSREYEVEIEVPDEEGGGTRMEKRTASDPGKPFLRPGRDAGAEHYRKAAQKAFR